MSAGRTTARASERLPRVTREAAVREAARPRSDCSSLTCCRSRTGWREHRDISTAARLTLDMGSKELVGWPRTGSARQSPRSASWSTATGCTSSSSACPSSSRSPGWWRDQRRRLAAIHAVRGELGVALTVHELEVVTKRTTSSRPGSSPAARLQAPAGKRVPDEPHGHPAGQHPAGEYPSATRVPPGRAP